MTKTYLDPTETAQTELFPFPFQYLVYVFLRTFENATKKYIV